MQTLDLNVKLLFIQKQKLWILPNKTS